jgi:hypothetical protein
MEGGSMADPAETMRDRGRFWSPAPDWTAATLSRNGWMARRVSGLGQTLVSGDLDAAFSKLASGAPEVGLWGVAEASTFFVRMARDRALLVTPSPLPVEPGWRGVWVATPCDDLYAVLDIGGEAIADLVAEGTSADLETGSRSAAVLFAGVPVLLYRTSSTTVRLHVESPLAAYLWTWLETRLG